MITYKFLFGVAIVFCLLSFEKESYAQNAIKIPMSGTVTLAASSKEMHIKVNFKTVRMRNKLTRALLMTQESGARNVTLFDNVKIIVNGQKVFIAPSVFSDIVNPLSASIQIENGEATLIIYGGDGADSYSVRIIFDSKKVYRRILFSNLDTKEPTEETRYWLSTLKDDGGN